MNIRRIRPALLALDYAKLMATTGLRVVPSRTERTIVIARVVLAASSLFAVWLDPTRRERYVVPAYTLHSIYVVYAIALGRASWNRAASGRWPLVTHLGDIAVCTVFQFEPRTFLQPILYVLCILAVLRVAALGMARDAADRGLWSSRCFLIMGFVDASDARTRRV